ncbi:hypothetical protein [Ligilactobacillus saerimneri]|uniref:Uncharacterized protein n=3 Tax=Ligilactobacillus saerimneri TaxID=228229 RepID=M5J4A6_9LACO|nr:hypothetical protein [Ligilactobacillus saerimneri]EKW98361.1 hypothetical protein D271_07424 [Ligilactobacillus saerimneri 30a]KRL74630.1 hypothetical protein FC54_GL001180 [Ligilactobacillus saerimneri DSM 16049]MBU5310338.1 antitoxin [Ligilactobacillus saerimneri]MCZ0892335.1 antitoxin [Ligilactobacillus saerimneri]MDI9206443.1 antitoxin [Ligilactobacillus saerimneri]
MRERNDELFNCTNFALYCSFYSVDEATIKEDPVVADYVAAHREALEALIAGYGEMGNLNQEICAEYLGIDCPGIGDLSDK